MTTAISDQPAGQVTVVCCIERGRLEAQTLLMLESLRRSGGQLGSARVLAVTPRRGTGLKPSTAKALEELGAELHDGSRFNVMPWYNWYSKVVAAQVAEEVADTPVVVWLDSDTLILEPPTELCLGEGVDFAARREPLPPVVYDSSSPYLRYWQKLCEIVGLRWDDYPWLPAEGEFFRAQNRVCNAGVYSFRRHTGFPEEYAGCTRRVMEARLATVEGNFWLSEQNCCSLAVVKLGLKFRELPLSENHMVFGLPAGGGHDSTLADAKVVHYSKMLYGDNWAAFMERLSVERPEAHQWLQPLGPIDQQKLPFQPIGLAYKIARNLHYKAYFKRCIRV